MTSGGNAGNGHTSDDVEGMPSNSASVSEDTSDKESSTTDELAAITFRFTGTCFTLPNVNPVASRCLLREGLDVLKAVTIDGLGSAGFDGMLAAGGVATTDSPLASISASNSASNSLITSLLNCLPVQTLVSGENDTSNNESLPLCTPQCHGCTRHGCKWPTAVRVPDVQSKTHPTSTRGRHSRTPRPCPSCKSSKPGFSRWKRVLRVTCGFDTNMGHVCVFGELCNV
jgi:hypothetical protein